MRRGRHERLKRGRPHFISFLIATGGGAFSSRSILPDPAEAHWQRDCGAVRRGRTMRCQDDEHQEHTNRSAAPRPARPWLGLCRQRLSHNHIHRARRIKVPLNLGARCPVRWARMGQDGPREGPPAGAAPKTQDSDRQESAAKVRAGRTPDKGLPCRPHSNPQPATLPLRLTHFPTFKTSQDQGS